MTRLAALGSFSLALLVLVATAGRPPAAESRIALVVGVSAYRHASPLPNTLNDANGVSAVLQRLGFKVQTVLDPDRAALEAAVRRFGDGARGADAAVFFYAGHALEVGGRNWLLPTSMELKAPKDLRFEALDVDGLLEQTEGAARITLLFLDACRDNPFQKRLTTGARALARGGLGQVSAGAGTLVAFATAPGTVAADGEGRNSPFTTALLRHIETPGLEVRQMLGLVRRDVREATHGTQIPWENAALEGEFYFKPGPAPTGRAPPPPARDTRAEAELLFWQSIKDSTDASDFRAYLARFPDGTFAALARRRAETAVPSPSPGTAAPTAAAAQTAAAIPLDAASSSLYGALLRRIEDIAPRLVRREERARSYVQDAGHKAMAVSDDPPGTWRLAGARSAAEAQLSALQSCQLRNGAPCILVATDEIVETRPAAGWQRRDLEEVRYAGVFDPLKLPVTDARRAQADVMGYRVQSGAKAAALHPWRRLFIATAPTQAEAEASALATCNADPVRQGKDGPCFLYASGNDVVLPQRKTVPLTPASAATPTAPNLDPQNPGSATEETLRPLLASLGRDSNAAAGYVRQPTHKALAVQVESGRTFSWSRTQTEALAEQFALETCQLRYGTPCALLALDDVVRAPDPKAAPRRDMRRVGYAGGYAADMVPFPLAQQARDRQAYATATGPKAMAIHAPRGVFWSGGATASEAQSRALAACNEPNSAYPCILYAIDDQVVLPQRRTEAAR